MFIPLHGQHLDVRLDLNNQPIVVIWQGGEHRLREISNSYPGGSVPGGSLRSCAIARFAMVVTAESALVPG